MKVDVDQLALTKAAFEAGARSYAAIGSPLYSTLCACGAGNPDILRLAAKGMTGAQPAFHLLTAVHCLLLKDPRDPLAQYFGSVMDMPLDPGDAASEFTRFCHTHATDIARILASSTIQTTFVDRCATLLVPISWVADQLGEPLNLVEIGCSAGVLLTLDRYAYALKGQDRFGPEGAQLTLTADIVGCPRVRMPRIDRRIGLDLNPLDPRLPEARRWLIAQIFPEFRVQREQLQTALAEVTRTDIRFVIGNALQTLPAVMNDTPDPVCIFHSVCLSYWSEEERRKLDEILLAASLGRTFYRVGSEPSNRFDDWNKGRKAASSMPKASGEISITRYSDGDRETQTVAETSFKGAMQWYGWSDRLST